MCASCVFASSFLFTPSAFADSSPLRNIQIEILIEKVDFEQGPHVNRAQHERSRQFITTLEGHDATIFVGKRVPQITPIKRFLIEEGYLDYVVEFTNVGTRLRAVPRIRNGHIEVEITPEISYETRDSRRTEVIAVRSLSSTISVPNGATVQLGSVISDSEFFDSFYRSSLGERITIFLTPRILD